MSPLQSSYAALLGLSLVTGGIGLHSLRSGRHARAARIGAAATAFAAFGIWCWRTAVSGHLPLFGTWENALSVASATMLAGVLWDERKGKGVVAATPGTSLVAALVLAQGIGYDATPYALTISERSLVVDIHALLAWIAFAVLSVAFALSFVVVCCRQVRPPTAETLRTTLTTGFLMHTAMIATGSLYKFMLFGRVWSWDPIETMALIAWLVYGTLIHMMLLGGWSVRRTAQWAIAAFIVLLLSYRTIVYFPGWATYHVFDLSLKLHL